MGSLVPGARNTWLSLKADFQPVTFTFLLADWEASPFVILSSGRLFLAESSVQLGAFIFIDWQIKAGLFRGTLFSLAGSMFGLQQGST